MVTCWRFVVPLPSRASPVSRLQSRAWSFTCPGRFARRTKKKERLLVVYKSWTSLNFYFYAQPLHCSCVIYACKFDVRAHAEITPFRKSILTFEMSAYRKQFLHWFFRFYKGVGFWQWSTLQEVPGWADKEAAWGHYNRSGLSHDVWQEVSTGFIVGEED